MSRPAPGPVVRDASTVMLVRDGADGLEVFMLRRSLNSDFVGGAYVFPGGAVDDADRHADLGDIHAVTADQGAFTAVYRAARFRREFRPIDLMMALHDRVFSAGWTVGLGARSERPVVM